MKILNTTFTGTEIATGVGGAATIGIAAGTFSLQNTQNEINRNFTKLQTRSTVRRDIAERHMTREEGLTICKQQGISEQECLNPIACEVKPQLLASRKQSTKKSTQLRGGGSEFESNNNLNSDLNRNIDSLDNSSEHYIGSQSESRESIGSYDGRQTEGETFIGVDPNVPYNYTGTNSRVTPFIPYILSGAFLVGYFTFQWLRKENAWFKRAFPNENQLMIENQIEMQHKLDKIYALQEKMDKNLPNGKSTY